MDGTTINHDILDLKIYLSLMARTYGIHYIEDYLCYYCLCFQVLRKKYYNMVEDMKGKIRVYCRVRPMSSSELERVSTSKRP